MKVLDFDDREVLSMEDVDFDDSYRSLRRRRLRRHIRRDWWDDDDGEPEERSTKRRRIRKSTKDMEFRDEE